MESVLERDPEAVWEREDLARLVHAALDYLPKRYSEVLELKYLEDLSVESIATRLGVTAVTVQSLLARARSAFRDATATLADGLQPAGAAPSTSRPPSRGSW
jgi:RNA polymerase sigma factor (sigma-70 family)